FVFFFSSRRRHTRCYRDWSSDVCSSDLGGYGSVPQRRTIEAVPTRNLQAYDYYLRGNEYLRRGGDERFQRTALRMYEKAVELDSAFALAYAMVSRMRSRLYLFHYDRSPEGLAAAKRA